MTAPSLRFRHTGGLLPASLRTVGWLVLLAGAAWALAYLSIVLTREAGRTAAIWPLNAIFLVLLMRAPRREWPGLLGALFAGNVAANMTVGDPVLPAVLFVVANIVEILVVAFAMTWRRSVRFLRRSSIVRFASASIVACMISTLIALCLLHQVGTGVPAIKEAAIWFAADLLGLLIHVPILWILLSLPTHEVLAWQRLALGPELALLILITVLVFAQSRFPLLFLVPPALVLVAIRKGLAGASVGMVVVALISIAFTLADRGPTMLVHGGPTIHGGPQVRVLVLQVFLAANALMALTVGASAAHRRDLIGRLRGAKSRLAERSLRERLMIQQAQLAERIGQVGYWSFRPLTGEVFWSPEVYRIYGVTPETYDPVTQDTLAPFLPEHRQRFAEVIQRAIAERRGWQLDSDLMRPSGEIVRVRSVGELRLTPTGEIDALFGVFKDVTADHELLERAREQEALYRLLADNSSDIIARYGRDSVFTYLSPSIATVLGYSPEDLIGKTTFTLLHPDDVEHVLSAWREGLASQQPFSVEYRALHRDGRVVWLEARPTVTRDARGEIIDFIDTVRDVSDRREREEALARATAVAESATRAKTEFLANMSHEIRTPLNGVIGFADLLAKEKLAPPASGYANRIQTSARALLSIVNDILDFSRIEGGMMSVQVRPFDPGQLVAEVVDLVAAAYPDPALTITTPFRRSTGALYLGDDDRIRQILLNLVGNAAKFTRRGSVKVTWSVRKGRLRMVVDDTGPGIPPERLETVFDSFSQADASISRTFGGSGLGLSISRSLAQLMGGDITLRSRVGKGTRVTLDLPAERAAREALKAPAATPRPRGPAPCGRVMVVDDVDTNRELIEIGLGQAGHRVTGFASGEAALAAIEADPAWDLILMDVHMPGMDGLTATRTLRALPGRAGDIPVVGLSANVLPAQIDACLDAGMDDHLGKPVDMEKLIALTDRLCGAPRAWRKTSADLDQDPAFDALKTRYRHHLTGVRPTIVKALDHLHDPEHRTALISLAHKLAGAAGSLGFSHLSAAAIRLEQAARQGADDTTLRKLGRTLLDQIDAASDAD
ncbi:ATP-binding protein [Brevundimonas sp. A19_0]|uniref:ATP-binding protein n=1 Tax=Brevundimonas sp. A19_0 TaxID=2821087 RepID=UPI001AD9E08B|nr:ATP-binding protein [Brevundimonas sp. A19_0]MBO9502273.1 PAS domain-containing protein [Brevundimonas sp. A19_0]